MKTDKLLQLIQQKKVMRSGGALPLPKAQDGKQKGPNVYTSSNILNSNFNPLSGDIYLNKAQAYEQDLLPHEMEHYNQWMRGDLRVNPDQLLNPEKLPATLNPSLPLRRPSIVANERFEGQMPYYNRRGIDQETLTNNFLHTDPSFQFVSPGLIYDKVVNPEMYEVPWSAEGQAQKAGNQYIGPPYTYPRIYEKGGSLPRAQSGIPLWQQLTNQALTQNNAVNVRDASTTRNYAQEQKVAATTKKATPRNDTKVAPKGSVRSYVQKAADYMSHAGDPKVEADGSTTYAGSPIDPLLKYVGAPILQSGINIANTIMGDRPVRNDSDVEGLAWDAANVLPFTDVAVSGGKSLFNKGKSLYNNVATGNSPLPIAWKVEKTASTPRSSQYITRAYTDREAELLNKYGKGMYKLTPEDWIEFEKLTKSGVTDFSKQKTPITRQLGYYLNNEEETNAIKNLKLWEDYKYPQDKNIRTWSASSNNGVGTRMTWDGKVAEPKTRLVIPSRYTADLGNNFAAMPYYDKRIPFIWNPKTGRINSAAVAEKELMGNVPNGFKVIGRSSDDGFNNIIIKPLTKRDGGPLPKHQLTGPVSAQLINQALNQNNSSSVRDQVASTAHPQVSQAIIKKKQNEQEQKDIKTYGSVERANIARAIKNSKAAQSQSKIYQKEEDKHYNPEQEEYRDDTTLAPEGSTRATAQDYLNKANMFMGFGLNPAAKFVYNAFVSGPAQSAINLSNTAMGDRPIRGDKDVVNFGWDVANVAPFIGPVAKGTRKFINAFDEAGRLAFGISPELGAISKPINNSVRQTSASYVVPDPVEFYPKGIDIKKLIEKSRKPKPSVDPVSLNKTLVLENNPIRVENIAEHLGTRREIKRVVDKVTNESISLKSWRDDDGTIRYYFSSQMPNSPYNAGKSYHALDQFIPKNATIVEPPGGSLSFDSFINTVKKTKSPKFKYSTLENSQGIRLNNQSVRNRLPFSGDLGDGYYTSLDEAQKVADEINGFLKDYDLPKANVMQHPHDGSYQIMLPHVVLEKLYKKGGQLTSEKALQMLQGGTTNGKPLSNSQKRYFSYIANKK
jgi:hypothetical protein